MKLILKLVAAACLAAFSSANAGPVNAKCPVSGKDIDASVTSKHTVVIGFCCEKCQAKFKKDPTAEKFAAAIKEAAGKCTNSVCPVSGKKIDSKVTASYKGQTVGFCCEKCQAKFKKDPKTVYAKVKADAPSNTKCPVSGKKIDPATAVVYTQEIGFCCEKCQAKFDKNPSAVLNKK